MKAEQIVVGQVYLIRHHGEVGLTEVRVDAIETKDTYCGFSRYSAQPQYRELTRYRCTKLSTGRTITVKSAAKFRRMATERRHTQVNNEGQGIV